MLNVETSLILSLKSGNRKVASHLYKNSNTKITISHKKQNKTKLQRPGVRHGGTPFNPGTPETETGEYL